MLCVVTLATLCSSREVVKTSQFVAFVQQVATGSTVAQALVQLDSKGQQTNVIATFANNSKIPNMLQSIGAVIPGGLMLLISERDDGVATCINVLNTVTGTFVGIRVGHDHFIHVVRRTAGHSCSRGPQHHSGRLDINIY